MTVKHRDRDTQWRFRRWWMRREATEQGDGRSEEPTFGRVWRARQPPSRLGPAGGRQYKRGRYTNMAFVGAGAYDGTLRTWIAGHVETLSSKIPNAPFTDVGALLQVVVSMLDVQPQLRHSAAAGVAKATRDGNNNYG